MASTRVRRSAGTNMYLNRLLFRKPQSESDLSEFRAGATLKVSGLMRRFEDIGRPGTLRGGPLLLAMGQPLTWRSPSGPMLLTGPYEVNELGGTLPMGRNFTRLLFTCAQGDFELAVPTLDLDLLRLALASTTAVSPSPPAAPADPTQPSRRLLRLAANLAMFFYVLGLVGLAASTPLAVGLSLALVVLWFATLVPRGDQLSPAAKAQLPRALLRDPRLLRDALFSLAYLVGLVLTPWIPTAFVNIWIWGILLWLAVALGTLFIRAVRPR
jgi:hypothetical protein